MQFIIFLKAKFLDVGGLYRTDLAIGIYENQLKFLDISMTIIATRVVLIIVTVVAIKTVVPIITVLVIQTVIAIVTSMASS